MANETIVTDTATGAADIVTAQDDALDKLPPNPADGPLRSYPLSAAGLAQMQADLAAASGLSSQALALGAAVRAERPKGVVDDLLEHPDAVVRAKAREAVASMDAGGAAAGILARAAIDTAREVDRAQGGAAYTAPLTARQRAARG
jgi:hypothetical protein